MFGSVEDEPEEGEQVYLGERGHIAMDEQRDVRIGHRAGCLASQGHESRLDDGMYE